MAHTPQPRGKPKNNTSLRATTRVKDDSRPPLRRGAPGQSPRNMAQAMAGQSLANTEAKHDPNFETGPQSASAAKTRQAKANYTSRASPKPSKPPESPSTPHLDDIIWPEVPKTSPKSSPAPNGIAWPEVPKSSPKASHLPKTISRPNPLMTPYRAASPAATLTAGGGRRRHQYRNRSDLRFPLPADVGSTSGTGDLAPAIFLSSLTVAVAVFLVAIPWWWWWGQR